MTATQSATLFFQDLPVPSLIGVQQEFYWGLIGFAGGVPLQKQTSRALFWAPTHSRFFALH